MVSPFSSNQPLRGLFVAHFAWCYMQVGSSVIAAWTDITSAAIAGSLDLVDSTTGAEIPLPSSMIGQLNVGYLWMALNCLCSAAYVSLLD